MSGTNGEMGSDEEAEDSLLGTREYSSPLCMLHELDPAFMKHPGRDEALARPPAVGAMQDREDVRLWRKAKRTVLIGRRLAMPAEERAVHSEAITAALAQVLPSCRGTLPGEGDSRMQNRPGVMAHIRPAALDILRADGDSVQNVNQALYANALRRDWLPAFGSH